MIFHSYVSLPEGTILFTFFCGHWACVAVVENFDPERPWPLNRPPGAGHGCVKYISYIHHDVCRVLIIYIYCMYIIVCLYIYILRRRDLYGLVMLVPLGIMNVLEELVMFIVRPVTGEYCHWSQGGSKDSPDIPMWWPPKSHNSFPKSWWYMVIQIWMIYGWYMVMYNHFYGWYMLI